MTTFYHHDTAQLEANSYSQLKTGDKIRFKYDASFIHPVCASIVVKDGIFKYKFETDERNPDAKLTNNQIRELDYLFGEINEARQKAQKEGKNEPMEDCEDYDSRVAAFQQYQVSKLEEYAKKTTPSTSVPSSDANKIKKVIEDYKVQNPGYVVSQVIRIARRKFQEEDGVVQKAKFPGFFKSVQQGSPDNEDSATMYYKTLYDIADAVDKDAVDAATSARDAAMRKTEEMKGPGNK